MAELHEYQWLVVVGAFLAFLFGFGTGANDVANAFGTSVGAKTLKLWHAVVIATIFEFSGAMVLGRVSTNTVKDGVVLIARFYREPEILMYGMACALLVAGVWNVLASYWEMNVSSTHSIIGGIIGFGMVYAGSSGINWYTRVLPTPTVPNPFPYGGVAPITLSWFFTPILTAIVAAIIFLLCRHLVLRRHNAYQLSFFVLPFFVFLTAWVCIYFVFTKGAKSMLTRDARNWNEEKARWVAACIAAGLVLLTVAVALPLIHWAVQQRFKQSDEEKIDAEAVAVPDKTGKITVNTGNTVGQFGGLSDDAPAPPRPPSTTWYGKTWDVLTYGMRVDVHAVVQTDPLIHKIHENAERFQPKVEYAFSFLQVFSAICVMFAHGANDVGLMAGPIAAIYEIYETGRLASKYEPALWCIGICAAGLVVGLATYGYNVVRAMGVRMAKLSPTRGFAAELATALVIMVCSQYALPNSTSQCITGGVIGVGLAEGINGVNWAFLGKTVSMWVLTVVLCALSTAAIFAQGVYAPSVLSGKQVIVYEDRVTNLTAQLYKDFNSSLFTYSSKEAQAALPNLKFSALNKTIVKAVAANKLLTTVACKTGTKDGKVFVKRETCNQDPDPEVVVAQLYKALALYQENTILTVGQKNVVAGAKLCNNGNATAIAEDAKASCPAPKLLPKGYNVTFLA